MITVIMPYWERAEAARTTLRTFDHYYKDDVKVVIVDDGSPTQPAKPLEEEFSRVTVISLPIKQEIKNPCTPVNIGAAVVESKYIALTNPETYHTGPVLYEMLALIKNPLDYVLAPTWCSEEGAWHCHPTLHPNNIPEGTGFHHMALMKKDLWDKTGGMDEEYRDGYCFDDTDFVMRLVQAGANFKYSNTEVIHVRKNAKVYNSSELWVRNKALYDTKWACNLNNPENRFIPESMRL